MLTYTRKWRAAGVERRDRNLEIWIIIFPHFYPKNRFIFSTAYSSHHDDAAQIVIVAVGVCLDALDCRDSRRISTQAKHTQHSHRKSKAIFFFRSRNLLIIFLTLCFFFASPLFPPITRLHRARVEESQETNKNKRFSLWALDEAERMEQSIEAFGIEQLTFHHTQQ